MDDFALQTQRELLHGDTEIANKIVASTMHIWIHIITEPTLIKVLKRLEPYEVIKRVKCPLTGHDELEIRLSSQPEKTVGFNVLLTPVSMVMEEEDD